MSVREEIFFPCVHSNEVNTGGYFVANILKYINESNMIEVSWVIEALDVA